MKLLLQIPFAEGGLARYAISHAQNLIVAGHDVLWLAPPDCEVPPGVRSVGHLTRTASTPASKVQRAFRFVRETLGDFKTLETAALQHRPDWVLLGGWGEYLAPLWARHLRRMRRRSIRISAVIHDPVRDYVRGPLWWHRLSLREAYRYLDHIFVHEAIALDTGGLKSPPPQSVIPHGPYPVPVPDSTARLCSRELQLSLRSELKIPADAFVILSFGHIRDGKNLHLLLPLLSRFPKLHLLVAGREQSGGQRPVAWYQSLARDSGVDPQCHWFNSYIPESEVWKYFAACDATLLTYSADFHSASGVLNLNAQFEKPVLASAGAGPLKTAVHAYDLGVWVEPDAPDALRLGLEQLMTNTQPTPRWDDYRRDNSWEENARRVVEAMEAVGGRK